MCFSVDGCVAVVSDDVFTSGATAITREKWAVDCTIPTPATQRNTYFKKVIKALIIFAISLTVHYRGKKRSIQGVKNLQKAILNANFTANLRSHRFFPANLPNRSERKIFSRMFFRVYFIQNHTLFFVFGIT